MVDPKKDIVKRKSFEFGIYQFLDRFLPKKRVNMLLGRRKKAFFSRVNDELKANGAGKAIPIDRRKDLSLEEFKNHYRSKGIPVVMEGAAKDWDCVKKWSLEYFKELHG